MMLLKEQYGKQVIVNLLGSRGGEEVLNRAFKVKAIFIYLFIFVKLLTSGVSVFCSLSGQVRDEYYI